MELTNEQKEKVRNKFEEFLISPKGRVPRAMPVGEWRGVDMIYCGHGESIFWSRGVSDAVSYRLDTKISTPHPESWRKRVSRQTFSEGDERDAGLRDRATQYSSRSYSYGDGDPAEIRGKRRDRQNKAMDGKPVEEKVCLVRESLLERANSLVARIFCFDGWDRRAKDNGICEMARAPGFRSSRAVLLARLVNKKFISATGSARGYLHDIFFNVLHVDFNDDVAYNHSLEYDFAETLGKVESHIERCLDETIPLNNEGGS